jgi:hypothetical protein
MKSSVHHILLANFVISDVCINLLSYDCDDSACKVGRTKKDKLSLTF